MADVTDAFLRGHQAGQQELAQQQDAAERNLRQMVLKHELSRMKVEDAAQDYQRQFGAAQQQYQGLHGQPAATIPSDAVTTAQPNLPSRNLAGVVNGLINGQGTGTDTGSPAPVSSSTPPAQPAASIPAPLAQDPTTGTHPVTTQVPRSIAFPGLPAALNNGTPGTGFSLRPQSAEDLAASTAATEAAKPYDLAPGAQRRIGPTVIGTNTTPRTAPAPSPEALANDQANRDAAGKRSAAVVAGRAQAAGAAKAEAERRTQWEQDFRQHNAEQSRETATFLHAHAAWQAAVKRATEPTTDQRPYDAAGNRVGDAIDPVTKKPVGEEPVAPVPQSFEDYQAAKQPGKAATPAPAAGGAPAGTEGQTIPIPGKPGQMMTMTKGKWLRSK